MGCRMKLRSIGGRHWKRSQMLDLLRLALSLGPLFAREDVQETARHYTVIPNHPRLAYVCTGSPLIVGARRRLLLPGPESWLPHRPQRNLLLGGAIQRS